MREYAIIGGGMGGCSAAALLHASGKDVLLLEKEPYLGGCASTFEHSGYRYNSGATTISGYGEGGIVRGLFDRIGVEPNLIESDPAIVVIQGKRVIPRYRDIDRFIDTLNQHYPHPKHHDFWHLIQTITTEFYATEGYYYSNRSLTKKLRSLKSFSPLIVKFWKYLWSDARTFIQQFYGGIDNDYLDFLDAQILIVAQVKSDSVHFLTAALALGYTFDAAYYPIGGMGSVCDSLTSKLPDVRLSHQLIRVEKLNEGFRLITTQGNIDTKNLIMGTSHFESGKFFNEKPFRNYYSRYTPLNTHQSAFLLYMSIPTPSEHHHHYQLIADAIIPHTLSKSLFVSLSDPNDTLISPEGITSITASIHTDTRMWIGLSPSEYRNQKQQLHHLLERWICDTLQINKSDVLHSFAATPKTFGRYINRTQLGGIPMSRSNLLPLLPSNDTPIEGFYHVGDTAYAAQGWPGIVTGSFNLLKLLDV